MLFSVKNKKSDFKMSSADFYFTQHVKCFFFFFNIILKAGLDHRCNGKKKHTNKKQNNITTDIVIF